MIQSFTPKIKVTLRKVPRRKGADRVSHLNASVIPEIDLTPFLGEQGGVTTHRGLNQPSGTFSIALADKVDPASMDTLYGSIEPMDMVEIRMARESKWAVLPIVMRGFVSHVERVETIGQDGRPMRSIHVTGHDFGKLLQIMQISYQREYIYGNFLLTSFPMFERFGVWYKGTAKEFVETTIGKFIKEFLGDMYLFGALKDELTLKVDASVIGARVGPYGIPNYEGDIWQLLTNWTDLGWNELFIEDRPDAAYLVYRPVPYYDLAGQLIMADSGAEAPEEIDVMADEVESLNVSRADTVVANFFQVNAPMAEVVNQEWIGVQATQNGLTLVHDNRNCLPEIYGLKKMTMRTNQAADDGSTAAMICTGSQKEDQARSAGYWYRKRLDEMKRLNQDNVAYEEGSLSMRGNHAIKPGMYIRLKRGTLASRYYVSHVTQQFTPFQAFKTTLQLTRGEGYIDRINANSSAYVGEKGKGAYG
jgi:hypothetical protein